MKPQIKVLVSILWVFLIIEQKNHFLKQFMDLEQWFCENRGSDDPIFVFSSFCTQFKSLVLFFLVSDRRADFFREYDGCHEWGATSSFGKKYFPDFCGFNETVRHIVRHTWRIRHLVLYRLTLNIVLFQQEYLFRQPEGFCLFLRLVGEPRCGQLLPPVGFCQ